MCHSGLKAMCDFSCPDQIGMAFFGHFRKPDYSFSNLLCRSIYCVNIKMKTHHIDTWAQQIIFGHFRYYDIIQNS